jgi:hypothetical protein
MMSHHQRQAHRTSVMAVVSGVIVVNVVGLYGDEIKKKSNDNDNDDEMEEGHLAYCLTELEPCMDHTDDPIVKVAAGYAHSTFLTQSGILYTTVGLMCDSCKHIL